MTQELRSCPFCGGEAIARDYDTDTDAWSVSCNSTDRTCIATVFSFNSPDEAAAAWNRRADDADRARLVAQVKQLEAELIEKQKYILHLERNGSNLEQQLAILATTTTSNT